MRLAQKSKRRSAAPLTAGRFAAGLTFHFAADLFPKAWMGFDLIHLPSGAASPQR